ncbi:MAG: hypothetical protein E7285_07220 [Lachnospiraceae bacterium]|nr:hypothetical protein [Lachnospiraceae bacterium]
MEKFVDTLFAGGYCDRRGGAVCATIVSLPNWESKLGIVLLCVKNEYLNFYEIDFKSNIGKKVAGVEIAKAENFVFKANFFVQLLSFDYEGKHYEFTNFGNHKALKQVFAEERDKQ